ncbi:hypothetical protein M3Y94_01043400 [Aphelenchoides besseyi]|nr:hypothetical protein M3Y94_01043400 [Aphelenchoides besseyi]
METRSKPQLNPSVRIVLFKYFKNDDIEEGRLSADGISRPHSLRLMLVSSQFCIAVHHFLKGSIMDVKFKSESTYSSRFDALGGCSFTQEAAQSLTALINPRFGHLKLQKWMFAKSQLDENFICNLFNGIPKLTISSRYVDPLFRQLLVSMAPGLVALECNCDYLKPTVDFLSLNLKEYKSPEDYSAPPPNMNLLLEHKIEKIHLSLQRKNHNGMLRLSKNSCIQTALKILVVDVGTSSVICLPQWFYPQVPNLKKLVLFLQILCLGNFAEETIRCLESLMKYGEKTLKLNSNIEQLVYDVGIMIRSWSERIEDEMEKLQRSQFFTSNNSVVSSKKQLSSDEEAKECPCTKTTLTDVLVLSKEKMKFFVYVAPERRCSWS